MARVETNYQMGVKRGRTLMERFPGIWVGEPTATDEMPILRETRGLALARKFIDAKNDDIGLYRNNYTTAITNTTPPIQTEMTVKPGLYLSKVGKVTMTSYLRYVRSSSFGNRWQLTGASNYA